MFTRRIRSARGFFQCAPLVGMALVTASFGIAHFVQSVPSIAEQAGIGIALRAVSEVTEYEPIGITTEPTLTPGQPLACTVQMSGGPANLTIVSQPSGYVSYSGTVNGTTTVQATTSPNATGTITIYAYTDGEAVVSTQVIVHSPNPPTP